MNNITSWISGWTLDGKLSALIFIPFAALVLIAALRLVKFAEVIIEKTKFGGAFVGGVLIAAATSIPELVAEVSQAANGFPAASVANEIGSNAFSAFLIAITILIMFKTPFMKNLGKWSRTTLLMSSALAFFVSIFMFTQTDVTWGISGALIGIVPLVCLVFFLITLVLQQKIGDEDEVEADIPDISVKAASLKMLFWSVLLIVFSVALNITVDVMMDAYNLNQETAGGIFLAFIGSLPEAVAFFALIKKKRYVGGVAALVGSHIFNIGITFFGDLSYTSGSYYTNASMHTVGPLAVTTGIMMLLLAMQAIFENKDLFKTNWQRIIMPSLITIGYLSSWVITLIL